jgi:hypothetical protein
VQTVFEVNECVSGPKLLAELVAGDNVAGTPQQDFEHIERLAAKPQLCTLLAQFTRPGIEFEHAKTQQACGWSRVRHVRFCHCRHTTL